MEHATLRPSKFLVSWFFFSPVEQPRLILHIDGSPDVTTQESDTTLTILEESIPDEEINEEIVDDQNVLTEVKLPACICKFKLLPCSSITQLFTQIKGVIYHFH